MRVNKSDENNTTVIANCRNQPIAVALDIENDTVVCNDGGIATSSFDIGSDGLKPLNARSFQSQ
jgi:hypothetical protein